MVERFSKNLAMPFENCSTLLSGSAAKCRERKNEVSDKSAKFFLQFFNQCNPEIAKEKFYSLQIQVFSICYRQVAKGQVVQKNKFFTLILDTKKDGATLGILGRSTCGRENWNQTSWRPVAVRAV